MTDRPIIFSAPMVRALLEGRKTQTRRVLPSAHPQFPHHNQINMDALVFDPAAPEAWYWDGVHDRVGASYPIRYAIGDRLWVREAFNQFWFSQDGDYAWPSGSLVGPAGVREIAEDGCRVAPPQLVYRESDRARKWFAGQPWRPSIHMPRWASRLTLIVTDVRVQRLNELTDADAIAEGINVTDDCCPSVTYAKVWDDLNKKRGFSWQSNPWVVALTFRTELKSGQSYQ